jgi:hypothetical protein
VFTGRPAAGTYACPAGLPYLGSAAAVARGAGAAALLLSLGVLATVAAGAADPAAAVPALAGWGPTFAVSAGDTVVLHAAIATNALAPLSTASNLPKPPICRMAPDASAAAHDQEEISSDPYP